MPKHPFLLARKGFSLIEVLIATAILSFGIVAVLCAFQTSLSALGAVRDSLWADMLIRETFAGIEGAVQDANEAGLASASGEFAGSYEGFRWETSVSDVAAEDSDSDGSHVLKQIVIRVRRRDGGEPYEATTYMWLDRKAAEDEG